MLAMLHRGVLVGITQSTGNYFTKSLQDGEEGQAEAAGIHWLRRGSREGTALKRVPGRM